MKLDYAGLTDEQIKTFVDNMEFYVEFDADIIMRPTYEGSIHEGEIVDNGRTGFISGMVLGHDIGASLNISPEDLMALALEQFKRANGDLDLAAENLRKHYSFE